MASLLPDAESKLEFTTEGDNWFPSMGGESIKNVNDRKEWFKKTIGDQYMDITLKDMLSQGSRFKIPDSISLLVVRNTEIDAAGEVDASFALREIPRTLTKIRKAVNTLSEKGFNQCVITQRTMGFICVRILIQDSRCQNQMGNGILIKRDA